MNSILFYKKKKKADVYASTGWGEGAGWEGGGLGTVSVKNAKD